MVDTLLSKFVKDFGDMVMRQEVSYLFHSIFAKIIIWMAFIFACLKTLSSLRKGELSGHFPKFFIAWLACVPVNGIPLGFTILNNLTTAFSHKLNKMTHSVLTTLGKDLSLPPGFVYNAIFRAASTEIEDPVLGGRIRNLVENCVPDIRIPVDATGSGKKWKPASPVDLFSGKSELKASGNIQYSLPGKLQAALNNRAFTIGKQKHLCSEYLDETRKQLAAYVKSKDPAKMPENLVLVGSNNGETQSVGIQDIKVWKPGSSESYKRVYSVAANLAQSAAIQKEMLKQYFNIDLARNSGSRMLMEKMGGLHHSVNLNATGGKDLSLSDVVTTTIFDIKTLASSLNKFMGLEGSVSNAAMLTDINQKMYDFPLFIAGIQLLVKVAFPVVCLLLFFSVAPFKMLSWVWIISLLTPSYIHLMRSISNSLHIYVNGISYVSDRLEKIKETEPAYLLHGLNFDAANRILEDATKLQQTMLTIETYLWGGIFMILPAGYWLSKQSSSVLDRLGRSVGYQVSNRTSQAVMDQIKSRARNSDGSSPDQEGPGGVSGAVISTGSAATGAAISAATFVASTVAKNASDGENTIQNSMSARPSEKQEVKT